IFLVVFLKIFRDNRTHAVLGGPAMSVFCLGLLGGFFTWTCFAFLLIAVPCFVYWYCYHRSWNMKPVGSFLTGFVVGISPLFFRIGTFAGGIKADIVNKVLAQDFMGFVDKLKNFIGIETNMAQSVYANYLEILSSLLFVLIIILKRDYFGNVISSLFQGRVLTEDHNGKMLLIWLYPLAFLTVFCLSGFADFRYFGPVYPFVFACNAIAIDLLLRYKSRVVKGLGITALAGLLLFSVADSIIIPLYTVPPNLALFKDKGYSYELLGCLVSWRFKQDPKRVMRIVNGLSDDDKRYGLLRGLGFELAIDGDEILIPKYISFLGNDYQNKPELLTAYNKGLVLGVGHQYFEETSFGEYYPAILRDISREEAIKYFEKSIRLINFLDQRYKQDCFTGLGIQFSIVAQEFGLQAQNVARWVDVEYQDDFLRGIQLGTTYSYRI
ncbi:MAG: hypothetical protein K8I00_13360, partial [Candidatus Omnitrophica bacterium]|nr:hypothetical protein [Candidatus Omnitrophota bacterium]